MDYLKNEIYRSDVEKAVSNVGGLEYFNNRKVWVIGATGLIGSFIVDCLLCANERGIHADIYAVSRDRKRLADRFAKETDGLHFMESDVISLDAGIEADVMIHCASYAYPGAFREKPVETMLGNTIGTYRVMEAARNNPDCRVLYISSGEAQEQVDHLTVRACYPVGKMAAETLCLSYRQEYGVDVVIARLCHTFGGNFTKTDNRATVQFLTNAAMGRDIVLNSDGSQVRSYAYVPDGVSALLTVLVRGETGKVYGIATDEACSIREFAQMCGKAAGVQTLVREASAVEKQEATPIVRQIVDNTELKLLGWKPSFTIEQGIKHSIEIVRQGME
jgi:nucleoside-diphosphate-sugar epimerase